MGPGVSGGQEEPQSQRFFLKKIIIDYRTHCCLLTPIPLGGGGGAEVQPAVVGALLVSELKSVKVGLHGHTK